MPGAAEETPGMVAWGAAHLKNLPTTCSEGPAHLQKGLSWLNVQLHLDAQMKVLFLQRSRVCDMRTQKRGTVCVSLVCNISFKSQQDAWGFAVFYLVELSQSWGAWPGGCPAPGHVSLLTLEESHRRSSSQGVMQVRAAASPQAGISNAPLTGRWNKCQHPLGSSGCKSCTWASLKPAHKFSWAWFTN